MSLDRCLFLARIARGDDREPVAERIERLARWHGGRASWAWAGAHTAAGAVRFDDRGEDLAAPLEFGEPLPAAVRDTLIDAPPTELRVLDGAGAALAVEPERAALVGYAGGPGTLFAASCGPVDAWSTHAVAAAWIAHGAARVDPTAVPEQLAAEFVGGDRSLVAGARPLAQAVRIVSDDHGARQDDYWPFAERWAPVPAEAAAAHAEEHLLASLERRARAFGDRHVSLTAGLDSRVVAVALRELGVRSRAFTWGEPDWEDVRGGADLARSLGLPHELVPVEWLGDGEALREVDRQVRWTEGAVPVGFARLGWPAHMRCFVTGAGGEVGRAFYYRRAEEHDGSHPGDVLVDELTERLAGASDEAVGTLAATLRRWVREAGDSGFAGFTALDVVYGEQRVRRWLRGMLPRLAAPMIPAFATPEVARALASLPYEDRIGDGFHRRFLAKHAPDLGEPEPAAVVRRRARLLQRFVGDRLKSVPVAPWGRSATPSALGERWDEHPGFRDWITDGVLASPLVVEPLGARWAARTRRRFLARDGDAERMVLAAAAPVALASALEELNG